MKKLAKKTHFVPRVVFRTAFAGVIPVCVAGACGGKVVEADGHGGTTMSMGSGSSGNSSGAGGPSSGVGSGVGLSGNQYGNVGGAFGVATGGFGSGSVSGSAFGSGVASIGFSDGGWGEVAVKAFGDATIFTVACIGFEGGPCGVVELEDASGDGPTQDGSGDAKSGDGNAGDGSFIVACAGFCGADAAGRRDGGESG